MPTNNQLVEIVDKSITNFRGDSRRLSNAIGYLFLTRKIGWRPALLMYDRKTIKDYDRILGIDSRTFFPEVGPNADKSMAWRVAKKLSNFWKAVRGETPGYRSTQLG